MSTTGSHGVCGPTATLAVCLHPRPVGNSSSAPAQSRMYRYSQGIRRPVQVRRPLAVLTNGTVGRNAKCCAGLCKASLPARRAPCQSPIALQSLVPNPSDPKPSSPATRSPQLPRTSGCGQACRRIAKCARCDRLPPTDTASASALYARRPTAIGQIGLDTQPYSRRPAR
jgi:hypothetical protein